MPLLESPASIRLLASLLLILGVLALRYIVARRIVGTAHILDEGQRRQLFYLRTAVTITLLAGLVVIWAGQLQNLILSLTAVMVAVVIATKELLMCLSGFLLRTTGRLFAVGDRIECNGILGEVTDHSLMSTALLEMEAATAGYAYTGRTVVVPNSLFLTHPVRTSAFASQYVVHRFALTLEFPIEATAGLERLDREARRAFAPFEEAAQQANQALDRRLGVDVAGPEPTVWVRTTDIGKMQFGVALFCPRASLARLERSITAAFLDAVHAGEIGAPGVKDGGPRA